jgi:hypothetical protein
MHAPLQNRPDDAKPEAPVRLSAVSSGAGSGVPLFLQTKLAVNQPGDTFEHEADRVAETAARPVSGNASKPSAPTGTGAGSPLPETVRSRIEPVLGADLGHVRVHNDRSAHHAAHSLGAKAFTHRSHIWLGAHQSAEDVPLIAHEATHVVQQTGLVHRKPADYQHPEDGGQVLAKLNRRIAQEGGQPAPATPAAAPAPGAPAPAAQPRPGAGGSRGQAPAHRQARDPEAARAARDIDPAKKAEKKAEVAPDTHPRVDRPGQEQPKVEQAAGTVKQEAEKGTSGGGQAEPPKHGQGEHGAEGKGEAGGAAAAHGDAKHGGGKGHGNAGAAAAHAAAVAGAAAEAAVPEQPKAAMPPEPAVGLADSRGNPLPDHPESDQKAVELIDRAQELREGATEMRAHAELGRHNAGIISGNVSMVGHALGQSEEGVTKSRAHLATRRTAVDAAQNALVTSEQKTQMVADQAPGFGSKADEGKGETGPMRGESSDLVSQNNANTPDDPEAAAKSREQGGKITQVGSDIGRTDDAVTQTKDHATHLQQDAVRARGLNTRTKAKIETTQQTLTQTETKLGQMAEQNTAARGAVAAVSREPAVIRAQAGHIDEGGTALQRSSADMEEAVHRVQADYRSGMASVPPLLPAKPKEGAGSADGVIQRHVDQSAPQPDTVAVQPAPTQATPPQAVPAQQQGGGDAQQQAAPVDPALTLNPQAPEPDAPQVNMVGAMPSWLSGVDPPSQEQQQQAAAAQQERRDAQLAQISEMANGHFSNLSHLQRARLAMRFTWQNTMGSLSGIKWPGWGHLAAGLIDPRSAITGVVSGLNMIVNGAMNFGQEPSFFNFLKLMANIATGITIILGSITALAALIAGIMTAISILSLGVAAPVTGPIIAFCATVMTTVGGWTIAFGKVALILQALVFIINLIKAACADNAQELLNQSDAMTRNVSDAGNVVMQMGMAKLSQIGGRALQGEIRAAGGGVRYAAQLGGRTQALGQRAVASVSRFGVGGATRRAVSAVATRVASAGRGAYRAVTQTLPTAVREAGGVGSFLLQQGRRAAGALTREAPREMPGGLSRDFLVGKNIPRGTGIMGRIRTLSEEATKTRMGVMIDDMLNRGGPLLRPNPARVAQARAAVEAGTATAQDLRVIVQQAAADTRFFMQSGRAADQALNYKVLCGACGTGRDVSAASIGELVSNSPGPVFLDRFQAQDFLGTAQHGYSVVTFANGDQFLVDPTFAQFLQPGTRTGGLFSAQVLRESAAGSRFARDLVRDGFVPLTEENATLYARALGVSEAKAPQLGRDLMQGQRPLLTEVVGQGRVSNVPDLLPSHGLNNVPDYTVPEAITRLRGTIGQLRANGDPQGLLPSLEDFLRRLETVPGRPAAPFQVQAGTNRTIP